MAGPQILEDALQKVGEILNSRGESFAIVIVGGTALNLLGIVNRATTDVDIIAFAKGSGAQDTELVQAPAELPAALANAASAVAEDLRLPTEWINTGPGLQWQSGLPPDLATRIQWRSYGGLRVGIVGRRDLIFLKLFAALDDRGEDSVHFQDLLALKPTNEELSAAETWVSSQDVSQFRDSLAAVIRHVRNKLELK